MMTRAEFQQIKAQRRMAAASLGFSKAFEKLRLQHGLSVAESVKLLLEQAQFYFKAATRGRR